MTDKPENPPAFPTVADNAPDPHIGMTLRDYFAGQALIGILAHHGDSGIDKQMSLISYQYADAMLEARLK